MSQLNQRASCAKQKNMLETSGHAMRILHRNAHFRDKGCRFKPPSTLFLTPLAPRRPRDREPLFLGLCSHPLFHHFCGPKISQAKNGFPRLTRPGLSKTAACATYCMDRFNYIWTAFLLPARLLQHANWPHSVLTQPSLNYLSLPKDHPQPAGFYSHLQLVSRLYIAVLTYTSGLSSL